ncbi:FadR/GntR family transcriptional regulator [Sulfitobacter delicatus]|uniref:DNA-binding transcriptional regulator, FadR family n=1 Tax=Sulfitobacter delicatus TaxID=218672 RepID=A0A1G7TBB5_9RHOB|nr:FadR/GntR family transcriptional regulator [Sulfitobacter delicatus]SDG32344.1 DNA-binding transcriptional regulator, FadR family [Sulfitobacter delicatus]
MTAPKLKIKKRQTLADQLYGQVLEQIVSNKLAQGEKLPSEHQIATAFGVSRPVVREALRKLQEDGLVEARRGVGTFVRRRPSEKLIEYTTAGSVAGLMRAMEARITVEKATARMAALRANPKDIARIETALQVLEESMQARTPSFDADYQFHRAIAEASGNEVFIQMLDCARDAIEQGIDVAQKLTREGTQNRIDVVISEHRQILEAIRAGDAEVAGVSMAYHLLQARTRITDHAGIA